MKLLQMSGCGVACSLAPSQADHTLHCSCRRQNGGCESGDKRQPKRESLYRMIRKIARKDVDLGSECV